MADDTKTQTTPIVAQKRRVKREYYNTRYAGYPFLHKDALAWANRIRAAGGRQLLTDAAIDAGAIMSTIGDVVVEAGGVACYAYGHIEPGQPYEKYIILTRYEEGGEWQRVNGVMRPGSYFVEEELETITKAWLKDQGIPHEPFTHCFCWD